MKGKVVKRMLLGIVSLLLVGFGVLLAASGIYLSPKYLEPWQKAYSAQFDDPRVQLVARGLLAANSHNTQPWKVRLDEEDPMAFYLYADADRLTPEVDPFARQTMITQGTFLEYVKVAGEELGYQTGISFFPEGPFDEARLAESIGSRPVAKVTLKEAEAWNSPLYDFMFLPDTNRGPYGPRELTSEQWASLEPVATEPGLTLQIFRDEPDKETLAEKALASVEIEAGLPRMLEETADLFRANEYQKNEYRYGFSFEGQGTVGLKMHILQGLITLFPSLNSEKASSDLYVSSTRTALAHTPAYAMLLSDGNSRVDQVEAGMAYSRLVLTAHSMGLVVQPLSQGIQEYPEMGELYRTLHAEYAPEGETIQMLLRVGEPAQEAPLSMRRDARELIVSD